MSRIRVVPPSLATVLVALAALLTLAVPAQAKVGLGLKASASDVGVVAAVTLKDTGRAPVRLTLQRKVNGRWVALTSATASRGRATLRWMQALAPGQALRVRVIATRGKRTVAISASARVAVDKLVVDPPKTPTAATTPSPRPVPVGGDLSNDVIIERGPTGPTPTPAPPTGNRISVSRTQACGVNTAAEVRCWPVDAPFDAAVPAKIAGVTAARAVVAGDHHTCAAVTSGAVFCWGDNAAGQLGDGTTKPSTTAKQVPGLTGVSNLVAGPDLTCANFADKAPLCWGTTTVRPMATQTGTLTQPSTIGLGPTWGIETISADRICGINRQGREGSCFDASGSQTPVTAWTHGPTFAAGTASWCLADGTGARCVGTGAGDPPEPTDHGEIPVIPGTDSMNQIATNGTTYCAVSLKTQPMCWNAPASGSGSAWAGVTIKGFND